MDSIAANQKWMVEQWAIRDEHPRWTKGRALEVCSGLRTVASQSGWLMGLYGSMLDQPTAGDLDLIFVNWRSDTKKQPIIEWLAEHHKAKVVDVHDSLYGMGVGMCTAMGYLIDLHFRTTPVTGRTVWEISEV